MQQILKKAYKLKNILNSVKYSPPHIKHYIVSTQYPSQKRLPEKSCPNCLRILMSCLFKDPVVVMKEIVFLLIMDPTVTVA